MRRVNIFVLVLGAFITELSFGMGAQVLDKNIVQAIESGNVEALDNYLTNGLIDEETGEKREADPNGFVTHGNQVTFLHRAAQLDSLPVVETLVRHQANVNALDKDSFSPLHYALLSDHTESARQIAMFLIEHGADIEQGGGHELNRPSHLAASKGYHEVLDTIIARDQLSVDILNRRDPKKTKKRSDKERETPLFSVVRSLKRGLRGCPDQEKCIRVLVAAGADVDYKTNKKSVDNPNNYNRESLEQAPIIKLIKDRKVVRNEAPNVLRRAVLEHNFDMAKRALGDGARLNSQYVRKGQLVEELYEDGQTILHIAAKSGDARFVQFAINPLVFAEVTYDHEFLKSSFHPLTTEEINKLDHKMETALSYAVNNDNMPVADLLIERVPEIKIPQGNPNKTTGLHLAMENERFDAVQYFLKTMNEEQLNQQDGAGNTPLQLAMNLYKKSRNKTYLDFAETLRLRVPEMRQGTKYNKLTPKADESKPYSSTEYAERVHLAVEKRRADVLYYLLYYNKEVLHKLVRARAIGTLNLRGYNCVHEAADHGYDEILNILLEFEPLYFKDHYIFNREKFKGHLNDVTVLPYSIAKEMLNAGFFEKYQKEAEKLYKKGGIRRVEDYRIKHDTALHLAARKDHASCVDLLIKKEADTYIQNYENFTPWREYRDTKPRSSNDPEKQRVRELLKNSRRHK